MVSKRLKEETIAEHKQAEHNNDARLIMDHSITLEQYHNLLYKNYIVYAKLEKLIAQFKKELPSALQEFVAFDKSERLKNDLLQQDFDVTKIDDQQLTITTLCDTNTMCAIGMLYVIEGSMLGGMMIANHLEQCTQLNSIDEHHFFGGNQRNHIQRWRKFIAALDALVLNNDEIEDIIKGAKTAFNYFDNVFTMKKVH